MRNFIKPAGSPARHRARGLAAIFASVALAAGLGAYPAVQAEEPTAANDIVTDDAGLPTYSWMEDGTPSSSATPSAPAASASASKPAEAPAATNPVTVERKGDVDRITINDPEGEAWEFGGKASKENIFALKREDKGEIKEVLSVTADGRKLEPYDYGFVNSVDGSYVAFNLNALHTIPPMVVEVEVRTTDAGEYAIAESTEVPSEAELAESGYGKGRPAEDDSTEDFARAATQANSTIPLSTSPLSYSNINGASGTLAPRGTLKTSVVGKQIPEDVYLTELVLTHNNQQAKYSLSGPITVRKNGGTEWCTVQPVNIKNLRTRTAANGGSVNSISVDLSSCDPQIIVWQGYGDKIDIEFNGPATKSASTDYSVELYGSYSPGGAKKKFSVVAAPGNSVQLEPEKTSGNNPYTTTSVFEKRTNFEKAVVEINAPNGTLAIENYGFNIDLLESGTKLERKVIKATRDSVIFEIYPVKDGKRVDSVLVEKGATLTLLSRFSDNPSQIDSKVTVYGTTVERPEEDTRIISEPDRAEFLEGRVKNPPIPAKCGLKIAIVADVSTSLKYADPGTNQKFDAFAESRKAAQGLVDRLGGTTTRVGVYSFARTARTQTPHGAVSIQSPQGIETVKEAIGQWKETDGGATNWEAALAAVQNQSYDVVYFITDGMPTWDNSGWQPVLPEREGHLTTGAFVQKTSLVRAVDAANKLKADGTRVVPLMVDLKLKGGNTVTQDYVLKDLLPIDDTVAGKIGFQRHRVIDLEKDARAVYRDPGSSTIVNAEEAVKSDYLWFFKKGGRGPDGKPIKGGRVHDAKEWAYGPRTVKQMGEDISGDGDTIRVEGGYSALKKHLNEVADQLIANCESSFVIQKNIVDRQGEILTEGAPDWEFTTAADNAVLDPGDTNLVRNSTKKTDDQGQVVWRIDSMESTSLNVHEKQQGRYRLFPVDEANARCTKTNGDFTVDVPVKNDGDTGFYVDVPAFSKVKCVVSNYEQKDEFVKLELKKLDAADKTVLSNAKFEVRSELESDGPFAVTWDEASQTYKTEAKLAVSKSYYLVETQAPTKDGQQYSLLAAPVEFQIVPGDGGFVVQIRDGENWTNEVVGAGLWTDRPQKFDAATGYLQVANVRQGNLPKTGGMGVQLPILLGGALIAAGALIGRRKIAA